MYIEYIDIKVRDEADLYGYSTWLASYLGLDSVPKSHRGLQHGWHWCPFSKIKDVLIGRVTQPNGLLVQDSEYANGYAEENIPAFATGLPFTNFIEYSGIKSIISQAKRSGKLLVPTHSFVGTDISDVVLNQVKWGAAHYENISVMLGRSDSHLSDVIKKYCSKVEIGAQNNDASSFFRIANIFSRYEEMLTTQMGSHVLYGTQCGLNVHVTGEDSLICDEIRGIDKKFYEYRKIDASNLIDIDKHEYVKKIYPELYDGKGSFHGKIKNLNQSAQPDVIAKLLGWEF